MNRDLQALAESNRQKALRTIDLVAASLGDYRPFDPTVAYMPKALEPYDALADRRFVRSVECALRFFHSHEFTEFGGQSDTTRTLLNRMEKLGLVTSTNLWLTVPEKDIADRVVLGRALLALQETPRSNSPYSTNKLVT